ncbi:MAG: L,D-transpeptidase family protein [bacterium]|nr:L,D-transpeptidase family protein [bacterium]
MRARWWIGIIVALLIGWTPGGVVHAEVDTDRDGLSDAEEQRLGTDPAVADTDGDSYTDGIEIRNGYDPRDPSPVKLQKRIEIDRKAQLLRYFIGSYELGEHRVSTGKPRTPTPKGTFRIASKKDRAWSSRAQLWMPRWMNFTGRGAPPGLYGIHELPEWRSGKKEGENHLGVPVSGGCIRLGVGPAQSIYAWADVGTTVVVR